MADGEVRVHFTPGAARVLQYAREEAKRFRETAIGPEHILLGLMHEPGGLPARALGSLGVSVARVQNAVRRQVEAVGVTRAPEPTSPWSYEARRVLEMAFEEAKEMHTAPGPPKVVGSAHLLLGLVREAGSPAAQLLRSLGTTPELIRREVLRLMDDGEGASQASEAEPTPVPEPAPPPAPEPAPHPDPPPPAAEPGPVPAPAAPGNTSAPAPPAPAPKPAAAETPYGLPKRLIDVNTCVGYDPHTGVTASPEEVKRAGQRWSVARAYVFARHAVLCNCQEGNAETLALCREDPFFRPVAVLSPTTYRSVQAVGQVRRLGFAFARLFPDLHSFALDGQACRDLLVACGMVGLPVMIPTQAAGVPNLLRALEGIKVTVILTHNHYSVLGELLALAGRLPDVYVDVSGVNTPDGIALLTHAFGPGHLLFGSAYPSLEVGCGAMLLGGSGLSEEHIDCIGYRNAERLLRVKP